MTSAARRLGSRPLLGALLASPSLPMLAAALAPGADLEVLLHPSAKGRRG
jgi:hypothetical protein